MKNCCGSFISYNSSFLFPLLILMRKQLDSFLRSILPAPHFLIYFRNTVFLA